MKLLITGASSILASKLVALLLENDRCSLRLLQHRAVVKFDSCETVIGDMSDPESLSRACKGIDAVLHLAALTHSSDSAEYFKINRLGTQNLIDACKKNDVRRFIYISSAAATSDSGAYGVSKLESEELVCQSGLEWTLLRPAEVYGSGMKEGIGTLIAWVQNLKIIPVIGDGSYCMSPVYIDDVVDAMAQVVLQSGLISQRLNLCGPESISFDAMIDRLSQYLQVRRQKIYIPIWMVRLGISMASFLKLGSFTPDQIPRMLSEKDQDIHKTSALISYSPRKLEEGLREYL